MSRHGADLEPEADCMLAELLDPWALAPEALLTPSVPAFILPIASSSSSDIARSSHSADRYYIPLVAPVALSGYLHTAVAAHALEYSSCPPIICLRQFLFGFRVLA